MTPGSVPSTERHSAPGSAASDPLRAYPTVDLDVFRHDVQTCYGVILHAERQAPDVPTQRAYHHAASLLAHLMWREAS